MFYYNQALLRCVLSFGKPPQFEKNNTKIGTAANVALTISYIMNSLYSLDYSIVHCINFKLPLEDQ